MPGLFQKGDKMLGAMATGALQAIPYIAQGLSAVAPYIGAFLQSGSGNGSSSNAQSQHSQQTTSMSGSESGSSQTVTQGSPSGIAGLMQTGLGTPTGSNWQQAFQASQGSAQTANNLQLGQWTMAQGMNAFSNMMANVGNLWSQTSARSYNRAEAAAQREWTQMMRQTAYQDTMKDMKAAGLNPILAASRGATASGSGSTASISPGNFSSMTSAAIPSAHAASAQSMYDYGNNTMQFMDYAMRNINNAKQLGMSSYANQMSQMTDQILDASLASSAEYATETEQTAKKDLFGTQEDKDERLKKLKDDRFQMMTGHDPRLPNLKD